MDARVSDQAPHAPVGGVQLGGRLVHERLRVAHRLGVVVVAQAAVAGQARRHALVPAVHRNQVDVDVDQQVRGGGALVDLDLFALLGLAQVDQVGRVLRVVLGQKAVGCERVIDAVAQGVAQLLFGHAAVQGQGGDQHHVVHAGLGGHVQDGLDHHLADVGCLHRGQGQGHVVEADRQLHAGPQQGGKRVAVALGMQQRVTDGPVGLLDRLHGFGRVHDPAPLGQGLEGEALAVPKQGGRR